MMEHSLRLLLALTLAAAPPGQTPEDPALTAAVERFFALQEAEDVDGYLALWSTQAKRPTPDQLKFVFDSGDDKFSDLRFVAASVSADRARVRVAVTRDRRIPSRVPDAPPRVFQSTASWSLLYVREGTEWKLLKEGPAIDALADSLIDAATPEEREAVLTANADLVSDQLVAALSRPAAQASQQGQYAAAQKGFELMRDVARRVGNSRLEGEALQNLANAYYFQRNFPTALQYYEERLALERTREDGEGIASALLGIATVRYAFADYSSALTTYREALALQEKLGDERVIATTLISTGNVLYLQGDFAGAIADYTRSRDINRRTGNFVGEADALEGLGRVLTAQGDYQAALDAFAGVLKEASIANNLNDQGTALLSIGDIHYRLGNLDNARTALEEARAHFEALKHLVNVGRAWQALALVDLAAGRFTLAEDRYRKSASACSTAKDQECTAGATVGLAFAQTAQEKYKEGIASYRTGIDAFNALKRREAAARAEVGLSHALAGAGEPAAALDAAGRARTAAEALANDDVLWRAMVAEAGALRRLRERPKAIASATAAVAAIDRLLEAARVRPSAPVARDSSSAFAILALLQAEDGDAAAAFESIERMRVHDLRIILAAVERDIARGMTPAERDEERILTGQLVSLHAQLSREKALPKPDAARIARLEKSASESSDKRRAQEQRLFERLPDLRVWRGLAPPATRADIAALLPDPSTLLMQLVVGEETLLIVVARRTEAGIAFTTHFEAASRRDIAGRVARLMDPATLSDPAEWRRAGLELIPGLTATFGSATRAIVIPHEVLWRVPFEALPLIESGLVADATAVVYAPSVTALVRPPARPATETPAELLLALAAAPLEAAVTERIAQTAPGWILRTPESAKAEVDAIAGSSPDPQRTAVLEGATATEASLRERLPAATMIHLAAPFRINGASALFSPLLLGPDAANDATLEAHEVMSLDLRARVAVLSDGMAMSMRDSASEAPTIAWAWRAAGVPALVLPRWRVGDEIARDLLSRLHERLRAGDSPEMALQAARAVVRADKPAPINWAGWMVIGGK